MIYDSVIIGAGPAGLTAAIYLLRSNLKVAIIEEAVPGGQMGNTYKIDNYPGFESVDGFTLATNMYMQVMNLGAEHIADKAVEITKTEHGFDVMLSESVVKGKTVIIATGMKNRRLGIPSETKYAGKGVSWCAICDGNFYKGMDVAVLGGGNSSLEESLYLSGIVRKVYLIHRRNEFRGEDFLVNKVKNTPNIELVLSEEVKELHGGEFLEKIELKSGRVLEVSGLFEYIGYLPNSELVRKFDVVDEQGYIITDESFATKIEGLFAAGDIVRKNVRQIVTAVNDGAIAALAVAKCCR
ncbi:MAG: FAD-dependent oxidoreductase [Bacilli bacterium]